MDALILQKGHKRLRGYTKVHRQDYLLLKIGFCDRHIVLYRLLFESIVDWDSRHLGYGTFEMDYRVIAFLLNWKESKVRRVFNDLCEWGFYILLDKQRTLYEIVGYKELELYRKGKSSDIAELFEYLEKLLQLISKSGENDSDLQLNFQDLKKDFPKLEISTKVKPVLKGQQSPKYSDNTVSSSDKSSLLTRSNEFELTEEDKRLIEESLKGVK